MEKSLPSRQAVRGRLDDLGALALHAYRRFENDRCLRTAASLSYTTLLALVPLMTIGFAMFSAFPAFRGLRERLQELIFQNLVPELGATIQDQFTRFVANTGELTAIGIVVLGVTALLMFATVENAFNTIWRVGEARAIRSRLLIFWAILTIGPLLMGASLTLSTYIFALTRMLDLQVFGGPLGWLVRTLPFLLEVLMFTLLYVVVPNTRVHWRHALAGGVIAAVLFEILKRGFTAYVAGGPAHQTIYGALSTVPLFLVWMYVSWAVVLAGAEIVASLPEFRHHTPQGAAGHRRRRLTVALGILAELADAARKGEGGRRAEAFATRIAAHETLMHDVLEQLVETRYIALTADGAWLLARDLESTRLVDLYHDLGLATKAEDAAVPAEEPWQQRLDEILAATDRAHGEIMGDSLKRLLAPEEGPPEAVRDAGLARVEEGSRAVR